MSSCTAHARSCARSGNVWPQQRPRASMMGLHLRDVQQLLRPQRQPWPLDKQHWLLQLQDGLAPSPGGQAFYQNISCWGPLAMQFVLQQGRAVNLMVEHHLEYDALVGLAKKLGQQGWVLWETAAALSGRSAKGTSGGALVITKATLAVTSFLWQPDSTAWGGRLWIWAGLAGCEVAAKRHCSGPGGGLLYRFAWHERH